MICLPILINSVEKYPIFLPDNKLYSPPPTYNNKKVEVYKGQR